MSGGAKRTKICFDHEGGVERLWAEEVGDRQFRLLNSPFFAYGLSLDDVVLGGKIDESGARPFVRVLRRSGRSTYRILVDDQDRFEEYWQPLGAKGCTYESSGKLVAVDVPASSDIYSVYSLLEAGEADSVWEFEEGHCGHPSVQ